MDEESDKNLDETIDEMAENEKLAEDNEPRLPGQTEPQLPTDEPKTTKTNWQKLTALVLVVALLLAAGIYLVIQTLGNGETGETDVTKNEIPLLRISSPDGPLDIIYSKPADPKQFNDGALAVNSQIYEGLVTYNDVSNIVPLLATSWSNPDDETWLFTLKDDVTFHNGSLMTAEDVKASIDSAAAIGFGTMGSNIESVEVIDPSTVEITTNGPDPLLLAQLVSIWIADNESTGDYPAGTGPYTVKAGVAPSETEISLEAFESYHGGIVYTKELQFKQLDNAAAVAEFNAGTIDIASVLVSDSEDLVATAEKMTVKDFAVAFLGINSKDADSPLSNLSVRQALEKAIDPELVIAAQGVVGEPVAQFVTQDIPGYNPTISRLTYSVPEAKALLDGAGFEDGFTVKLSYGSESNKGMFTSISEQLSEIGITVEEDFYGDDFNSLYGLVFGEGPELFFLAYGPDILDASNTFSNVFFTDNPYYDTTEIDSLLVQAGSTLDETARLAALQEIGTALHDDVASIPLYFRDNVTALADDYVVNRDLPTGGSGFLFYKVYLPEAQQ